MSIEFGIDKARDGNEILVFKRNGELFYLQSKYNPIAEAKKQAEKIDFSQKHIVVIGGGNPYYVKEIFAKIKKGSRVFYIEPHGEMMNFVVKNAKLDSYISKFESFIAIIPQLPDFEEKILSNLNLVELDKIDYAIHPIADKYFKKEIDYIVETINKIALQLVYDFVTRAKDGRRVQKNILGNLDILINSVPIVKLKNIFSNVPAVLVSAGPSLDKNIVYLKDFEKRGVIISTDTALKPLLSAGIEPHFVVSGDPSYFNYLHLKDTTTKKSFFVSEPSIDRRAFQWFVGRTFITIFDKPLLEQIEKYIGEIGHLKTWGSVASLAIELAKFLGCNPVYFIGQDLSFPYMLKYTRKTVYDSRWVFFKNNENYLRTIENSIINASDRKDSEDIYGRKVYTSFKMESYKEYILSLIEEEPQRFVNLSEGGIFKIRTDIAWKRFLTHNKLKNNPFLTIERIIKNSKNLLRKEKLTDYLKLFIKKLNKIEKEIKRFLEKRKRKSFFTEEELYAIYNKIYEDSQLSEIIENYTQEPIYKLLKAINKYKDSGNFENLKNSFFKYYEEIFSLVQEIKGDFISSLSTFSHSKKAKED